MKKLILAIVALAFLLMPFGAWAAGTVTQTFVPIAANINLLTFTCTADASANTYPDTDSKQAINGYVFLVITDPDDDTAPTAAYDITLKDSNGVDVMGGELSDRSDTASEQAVPKIDAVYGTRWVDGILSLAISGNSVASAVTVIKVFIYR